MCFCKTIHNETLIKMFSFFSLIHLTKKHLKNILLIPKNKIILRYIFFYFSWPANISIKPIFLSKLNKTCTVVVLFSF